MDPITRDDVAVLLARTGWTQARLARALGVSQAAVSHWLAMRRGIGPMNRLKLRRLLAERRRDTRRRGDRSTRSSPK
jgi:predicted transcriptional regulator